MAMKNITMRIDENLKKEAEQFFEDLGMSMTTAYTIFLKQSLRKQKFPFEIERTVPSREEIGKQLLDLIKEKNIPHKSVEVNAEGHIIVDKNIDPELYDWGVNG